MMPALPEPSTLEVVFAYIHQYIEENGFPPSLRDISKGCYIGRSTVIRYLDKLEAQGRVSRVMGKARSLAIIQEKQ